MTSPLSTIFTVENLAKRTTQEEFQKFLKLAKDLGADDAFQSDLKDKWNLLRSTGGGGTTSFKSGTTFMEDPVNGTRSAVVFDNSSDMSGATGIFWNPLQDDGSADGGKSTYSPPYSRGESLQDRMARMTAGQNYQELEKKLTKAVDSNSLLMGKVEDLKKNCEEYERENQNLKTKLQTETRRLNDEAILQTRQHLTECKKHEREMQDLKDQYLTECKEQTRQHLTECKKYEREMQRLNEAIRRERELLITERKDHEHEMQVLKDHIKVLAEHYEGQN